MAHKEGHTRVGCFKEPYHSVLRYTFNWCVRLPFQSDAR